MTKKEIRTSLDPLLADLLGPRAKFKSFDYDGINQIKLVSHPMKHKAYKENYAIGDYEQEVNEFIREGQKHIFHKFSVNIPENIEFDIENNNILLKPSIRINNQFNFYSDYVDFVEFEPETKQACYYLSFANDLNANYQDLFSLPDVKEITFSDFEQNGESEYMFLDNESAQALQAMFFDTTAGGLSYYNSLKKEHFPYYNELVFTNAIPSAPDHFKKFSLVSYPEYLLESRLAILINEGLGAQPLFVNNTQQQIETANLLGMLDQYESDYENEKLIFTDNQYIDYTDYAKLAIVGDLEDKLKTTFLSPPDILKSEFNKIEPLILKIEKFAGAATSPIQTFYLKAEDFNTFIDTQVNVNKSYSYRFTLYVISYGTALEYKVVSPAAWIGAGSVDEDGDEHGHVEITIEMKASPDTKVFGIDLGTFTSTLKQNRSAIPNLSFVNYSNNSNYIKILIEQAKNHSTGKFIPVTVGDDYVDAQGNPISEAAGALNDETFEYSSLMVKAQLFRISDKPTHYRNFSDHLLTEVDNNTGTDYIEFYDYIRPEKKYYYMARTLNNFDEPSSPSPIYEVYITKASGESKVVVSLWNLKPLKTKQKSRTFNRFMQLTPSEQQVYVSDELGEDVPIETYQNNFDIIQFGDDTARLWNRKFKFRIRSKQTGRYVDFDIKFKLKKNE